VEEKNYGTEGEEKFEEKGKEKEEKGKEKEEKGKEKEEKEKEKEEKGKEKEDKGKEEKGKEGKEVKEKEVKEKEVKEKEVKEVKEKEGKEKEGKEKEDKGKEEKGKEKQEESGESSKGKDKQQEKNKQGEMESITENEEEKNVDKKSQEESEKNLSKNEKEDTDKSENKKISDSDDEESSYEEEDPEPIFAYKPKINSKVSLWQGDITHLEIDGGIVNAANESLMGGGGIDGAIHNAAGPTLKLECKLLEGADTGETKLTLGHKLPSKYIFHTVGPRVSKLHKLPKKKKLTSCYQTTLDLMVSQNIKSVAFCAISTGIFGYPLNPATHTAMRTVRKWLEKKGK